MSLRVSTALPLALLCLVLCPMAAFSQARDAEELVIRVTPAKVTLAVGSTVQLKAEVVDVGGRPVKERVIFFSRARRSVSVSRDGKVKARKPGTHTVIARVARARRGGPSMNITVTVPFPKPAKIVFNDAPTKIYMGTAVRAAASILDAAGIEREDISPAMASSDESVASIDAFGFVTGKKAGRAVLKASVEGINAEHPVEIVANPVSSIELSASGVMVRTGDVIQFVATPRTSAGVNVDDIPVQYSVIARPDDNFGPAATGQIEQDGRFVASAPGLYTIVANCGSATARKVVRADVRFKKKRKIEMVGRGEVNDTHTSDLWVWEGVDGRDYCVTGTWGATGEAHFWDVTKPSDIKKVATVKVDARTVNDVKVSEDGKICVLSREGASNRKNGIVILDVVDPSNPKILAEYTKDLTGGVHNVFIDGKYVYALSAGRRYDIIDISNPKEPKTVSSYQVFEPGASIHDVWVEDGIAYSSNWRYGVHMVDVGNGIAGGSPTNPKKISSYAYPNGWNHAAFPYKSSHTGKNYVIAGDEAFPLGLHTKDKPTYARGWMHFLDFSDLKNPKEVARYEVPEAGTHNLWVEDDILYAAYYNGGLRIVDISGDLMGNLYDQGREIASYLPASKDGYIANAPFVWGPQPYKGHIFFSDWNSGLWAAKLVPNPRQ